MEKTFVMVKPDGVRRALTGEVIRRYEVRGLKVVAMRQEVLSSQIAEKHYGEHSDKPFFRDLVAHVTSGPVVLMVVEGENAIAASRKLNGATNPIDAEPGTIRGDFALEITENIVHGSDAPSTAEREIGTFFPEL